MVVYCWIFACSQHLYNMLPWACIRSAARCKEVLHVQGAGVLFQVAAWSSSTSAQAAAAAVGQQLVRTQQHQEQQNSNTRTRMIGAAAAAAAAATAAATCVLWSSSSSTGGPLKASHYHAVLAEKAGAGLLCSSPHAATAVLACGVGPLMQLLYGWQPSAAQQTSMAAAIAAEADKLTPWELVDSLWGLGMLGVSVSPEQLDRLSVALQAHLRELTAYQAIAATWALILLCGSSSSSSSKCSDLGTHAWQQLLQRLKPASVDEYDEASVLYLLHAAVQQAATTAAAGQLAQPQQPQQQQQQPQHWGPRASQAEVMAQLQQLPYKVQARMTAAYQEYMPFQAYIEGSYMVILHTAKTLPAHINAAAAAAAGSSSSDGGGGSGDRQGSAGASALSSSPYVVAFGGFSAADAAAASTLVLSKAALAKLKRDLYFRWRSDELLDRHQQSLNQVAYVMNRRLGLTVQQPPDVDILLPTLRVALVLDDGQPSNTANATLLVDQHHLQIMQQPFTGALYWCACHDTLLILMRNGFSAPPGGFLMRSTTGLQAAKWRCLASRGWHVVHLQVPQVEVALATPTSGRKASHRKEQNVAALEVLLRSKLAAV